MNTTTCQAELHEVLLNYHFYYDIIPSLIGILIGTYWHTYWHTFEF